MKASIKTQFMIVCLFIISSGAIAQKNDASKQILITNAKIFNGTDNNLAEGMSVLVEGNKISKISKSISAPKEAIVIDAEGKTLMPGLIEGHSHIALSGVTFGDVFVQASSIHNHKIYLNSTRYAHEWGYHRTRYERPCVCTETRHR